VQLSVPETSEPIPQHIPVDAYDALHSGKLTVSDLHLHGDLSQPSMVILVPVFHATNDSIPLGVVALIINPYRYLYPLISDWPR
jgi:DNA-binding helix-hairpin-helix protein with protein kinase domain